MRARKPLLLLVPGLLALPGCLLAPSAPSPSRAAAPVAAGAPPVLTQIGAVLAEAEAECEIKGLAEYGTEDVQVGACSPNVYVRACREAQQVHRERCREFCSALKDIGGRLVCTGSSSPVAKLFDPDRHCREIRHEQFEVSCEVRSDCSCKAGGGEG